MTTRRRAPAPPAALTLADLTADPHNPRTHPARNVAMMREALETVGPARSIVIDDRNTVLAGNGIRTAAQALGLRLTVVDADADELVAVRRSGLTPDQKRALALYDNRAGELAEWNPEQLRANLDDGLDLAPWFAEAELATILRGTAREGQTDPDAVPEARATTIKAGDLFALGAHRLLCGDGTDAAHLARVLEDRRPALLVTSPPYNLRINKFARHGMFKEGRAKGSWIGKVQRLAYNDAVDEPTYQAQQAAALETWASLLAPGASVFYNHQNRYRDKAMISPLRWLLPGPLTFRQEIIWRRPGSITQNARMFLPSDQRIYWLYKGEDFYFDDSPAVMSYSTVWDLTIEPNLDHAVPFPVELPRRCLEACSRPRELVLEPYCGSGTTMIAAEQLGRLCAAIEILPVNCQITIDRWEAFTGQHAIKLAGAARPTAKASRLRSPKPSATRSRHKKALRKPLLRRGKGRP